MSTLESRYLGPLTSPKRSKTVTPPRAHAVSVGSLALPLLLSMTAAAQDTAQIGSAHEREESEKLQVYRGPKLLKTRIPEYPASERVRNRDGWVEIDLMVDPTGKPYEIAVSRSSGNPEFEKAALRSVRTWRFEPATFHGEPVHAGDTLSVKFRLTGGKPTASRQFARAYGEVQKAIEAGDRAYADEKFAKLEVQNLYEEAFYHVAKYRYSAARGNESQQLNALEQAATGADYLPEPVFANVLEHLMLLQIKRQDFAGALQSWDRLQNTRAGKDAVERWAETVAEVKALRTSDRPYTVAGDFEDASSWFYSLFRTRFRIAVDSGRIVEIKLRCDRGYVFFEFDPELEYTIGEGASNCRMELLGDPGTTFRLTQS